MPELRLTYAQIGAKLGISNEAARMIARRKGWPRQPPNRPGAPVTVTVPEGALEAEQWRSDDRPDTPDEGADRGAQMGVNPVQQADEANARADAALALADRLTTQLADALTRADRASDRADRLERDLSVSRAAIDAVQLAQAAAEAETAAIRTDLEVARSLAAQAERHVESVTADLRGTEARLEVRRGQIGRLEEDRAAAVAIADEATRRAQEAQERAEALTKAEAERRGQGLWTRLRGAWRGE